MSLRSPLVLASAALLVVLAGCTSITTQSQNIPTSATETIASSAVRFTEAEYDFGTIKQSGGIVTHDFAFTYTGTKPLTITGTPGSCACTTAATDKKVYQPGEAGVLTVKFNPNLHAEPEGQFYKTVTILSEPAITPAPEIKIWTQIDLDLGPKAFELQSVVPHTDEHDDHYK